jgi:tRNA/tmRNA/rRNA uracil-C5-methylase (TrmA/RlmC/RlmD family)
MTSHGDGVKIPRGFDPVPFSYRELVSVSIHGINHMGVGVGKVDVAHGDGTLKRTVLVPMGLPGETVLARVYRNMPDHSEADLGEGSTRLNHYVAHVY